MGRIPVDLRRNIAVNIRNCRQRLFPKWGGAKRCAESFGVSAQKWSQWERGAHTPDEFRMIELARFFDVTTEWLRGDNSLESHRQERPPGGCLAVRIDDGVEVPLRVEVERVTYQSNYIVKMERIL